MYHIKMRKIKGMPAYSGEKYGLLFIQGSAVTESEYLATRLGQKKGFEVEKITAAAAKKLNIPVSGPGAEPVEEETEETVTEE